MMQAVKDLVVAGADGRPLSLDLYYRADGTAKPLLLFAHGFKGFKDWGHWDLIARQFAQRGWFFVKFNFSHNGVTPEEPLEFVDLEAFGQNNYSRELEDVEAVLAFLREDPRKLLAGEADLTRLALIGHSRGGALAIVAACRFSQIKALITWAAVSSLSYAWPDDDFVHRWHKAGVYHVLNARTQQQMPLYYQLYEDFAGRREAFDIRNCLQRLHIPILIVHGADDPAVPVKEARLLKAMKPEARLAVIEGADHVFNGRHPFEGTELPRASRELVEQTCVFLEELWGR